MIKISEDASSSPIVNYLGKCPLEYSCKPPSDFEIHGYCFMVICHSDYLSDAMKIQAKIDIFSKQTNAIVILKSDVKDSRRTLAEIMQIVPVPLILCTSSFECAQYLLCFQQLNKTTLHKIRAVGATHTTFLESFKCLNKNDVETVAESFNSINEMATLISEPNSKTKLSQKKYKNMASLLSMPFI
ncbi:DNA excision repair protein ERCC-1 [Enteropsectra breve]|nr:DNA excision repair protein ERCC-1 [Enteropsectra breve]